MAYATVYDVQARMSREMDAGEQLVCTTLLDDAAVLIDNCNSAAADAAKKVVSCRMVIRALGVGPEAAAVAPIGASQGSQSALSYSQSWTMGSGGSVGELYLGKADRQLLGAGNRIGSYSPVQQCVPGGDAQ